MSAVASVSRKSALPPGDDAVRFIRELREQSGKKVSALAEPDDIRYADNLPKTRGGEIMRRPLCSIAKGDGDHAGPPDLGASGTGRPARRMNPISQASPLVAL